MNKSTPRTPLKQLQKISHPILLNRAPPTDRDIVQCLTNIAVNQRLEITRLRLVIKELSLCL